MKVQTLFLYLSFNNILFELLVIINIEFYAKVFPFRNLLNLVK